MKMALGSTNILKSKNDPERVRLKTTPVATYQSSNEAKGTDQTILPFHFSQYPFLNATNVPITALKTTVNFALTPQALQKLVSINHPNLIPIRKIIKNNPKDTCGSPTHPQYSIYYEAVHYNIRHLVQNPNDHPRLYNLLMTTDLRCILNSLSDYLDVAKIFQLLQVDNIGISLEGNIKVYLPPSCIFASKCSPQFRKSVDAISEWFENCQQTLKSNNFKKEKKILQLQPPKLTHNQDLGLDETSVRDSTLERELQDLLGDNEDEEEKQETSEISEEKTKLKISTNSLSRVGSIQLEKINRINQEIKCIREKINNKKSKPPSTIVQSNHQNNTSVTPKSQGLTLFQQLPERPEGKGYYRQPQKIPEPIQQNIHCINIYNHSSHIPPNRYHTLPNFIQQPQLLQNPYQPYDPEIYGYYEDNYSQDTYDIEFQNQFEPTGQNIARNSTPFRHTIFSPGDRDMSEYRNKQKGQKQKETMSRDKVNQVSNKNYTESAGPLQFKGFFNKYMKGHTDTIEEQSLQASRRLQHASSGYGVNKNRGSLSVEKGLTQKQTKPKVQSHEMQKAINIKRNYSQNIFSGSTRLGSGECSQQIEQKVKKALQKTKNAIALLNKVKKNKSSKIISIQ